MLRLGQFCLPMKVRREEKKTELEYRLRFVCSRRELELYQAIGIGILC